MKSSKMKIIFTLFVICFHAQLISCQRPIVNSSTAATSLMIGGLASPSTPFSNSDVSFRSDGSFLPRDMGKLNIIPYNSTEVHRTIGIGGAFGELKKSMYGNGNSSKNQNQLHNMGKMKGIKDRFRTSNFDRKLSILSRMTFNNPVATIQQFSFDDELGIRCTFEVPCAWTYDEKAEERFQVVNGYNLSQSDKTGMMPGPSMDGSNDGVGHFLYLRFTKNTTQRTLTSPNFSSTRDDCTLDIYMHQSENHYGTIKIIVNHIDNTSVVTAEVTGNNQAEWIMQSFKIGRIRKDFNIVFEVIPKLPEGVLRGHLAIDNLRLNGCFPESIISAECNVSQVIMCNYTKHPVCIRPERICDIIRDCDENEDETRECDKMPFGSRCNFEDGWCGWENSGRAMMDWSRHSGSTPTDKTGPDGDHTFLEDRTNMGHYMFVNMNQHANDSEKKQLTGFASNAVINSQIFNPPPRVHSNSTSMYRNSCIARFYVHQLGLNPGSINLSVVEMKDKENITTTLWWSSRNLGHEWRRTETILPNISSRYYLQFEARMGMRIFSDVAIDDFSLSPECFGLNIHEEELDGYNYWDPHFDTNKEIHKDFENKKFLELTSCSARGRFGPTPSDCMGAYDSDTIDQVKVNTTKPYEGTQVWTVPNEDYYTIIVKGAGGGLGSAGVGSSRGAAVMTVVSLHKDEKIHILVGQPGEHACIKSIGQRDESCESRNVSTPSGSKLHLVKNMNISDGSGGGGGASFVFLINHNGDLVPLMVAGGGGGLGIGTFNDDIQHGRGIEEDGHNQTGQAYKFTARIAGAGGGWSDRSDKRNNMTGESLLAGGVGGTACYQRGMHGYGGFGGGGGGCTKGGAGGGYAGGDSLTNSNNGQGGTSYLSLTRAHDTLSNVAEAANSGSGSVIIIPAIEGCGCDYRCVALDEYRSEVACICPQGWVLNPFNTTSCENYAITTENGYPNGSSVSFLLLVFVSVFCAVVIAFSLLMVMLYNRYQRKRQAKLRHKMLLEQDLQLSRLRNTPDNITSPSVNIDYGCDGIINGNVDVKSLPQVARESLRLIKALGQGAFGEVYQGIYKHRDGDGETPVAVKTLPEMSTGQAESDFLMEAAIMAKFNHPNIVHLIGVTFDRHPRFIVLELLAGGDLKNFLREGRNKPERPSPLTMKDLIFCALDVAKGCRYLESKRFIHRDIAARNCLLNSKGSGRVVKIADFGMARDIYRSDYYRKGGKAMLPIKWMPPEAFLDGLFTSKTDVWSFGVLLWEVFSLGLMPYTGLPNRDVMQLVTGGGRLDSPPGCPQAIYRIMADCWNPTPELRPSFSNLLERLTACSQDAEIMNSPLPSFFRAVSSNERDTTIMRPPHDDFCLQVPNSDYLIPLQPRSAVERLLNEATGVTIPDSLATMTAPTNAVSDIGKNKSWETSFSTPKPSSTHAVNGTEKLQKEASTERLISLDTPQQTPTAMQPPTMPFGTPLSALNNNEHDTTSPPSLGHDGTAQTTQQPNGPVSITTNKVAPTATLDASNLIKQGGTSYANIKMLNANNLSDNIQDKICSTTPSAFTVQGFNDRYKNENHSEISC